MKRTKRQSAGSEVSMKEFVSQAQQIVDMTYEICKQKSGDGSNPIYILHSGSNKLELYDKVRELRQANSGDGNFYWMRVVTLTTRDLNKKDAEKVSGNESINS